MTVIRHNSGIMLSANLLSYFTHCKHTSKEMANHNKLASCSPQGAGSQLVIIEDAQTVNQNYCLCYSPNQLVLSGVPISNEHDPFLKRPAGFHLNVALD